jgi:hypothetical protein
MTDTPETDMAADSADIQKTIAARRVLKKRLATAVVKTRQDIVVEEARREEADKEIRKRFEEMINAVKK